MGQYMLSLRRAWAGSSHVHVVWDGAQVDDDDLVSFLFHDPQKQFGSWGPPQDAILSGERAPKRPDDGRQKNWFRNRGTF